MVQLASSHVFLRAFCMLKGLLVMPLEITRTQDPSSIICHDDINGHFFTATTRTGAPFAARMIGVLDELAHKVFHVSEWLYDESCEDRKSYVKIRHVSYDDKNGGCSVDVDYLHDQSIEPECSQSKLCELLGDGVAGVNCQVFCFEVHIESALFSSDYFHPNNKEYYEKLSSRKKDEEKRLKEDVIKYDEDESIDLPF